MVHSYPHFIGQDMFLLQYSLDSRLLVGDDHPTTGGSSTTCTTAPHLSDSATYHFQPHHRVPTLAVFSFAD